MDHYQAVLTYRNIMISCLIFLILLFTFGLRALTEVGGEAPLVRLESKQIEVSEEAILRLILVSAPGGLRRYYITVSVSDSSIARIRSAAKGAAMDGLLFQVLEQTEKAIEFRALSLFETRVLPGAQNVALADIRMVGLKEGQTQMDVKVSEFVDNENLNVTPDIELGRLKVVTTSTGPFTIGDLANAHRDLDDDGLYEDINEDGKLTPEDVFLFAFNFDSEVIQMHGEYFDFDGDGGIDFDDAAALAKLIEEEPYEGERSETRLPDGHADEIEKAIPQHDSPPKALAEGRPSLSEGAHVVEEEDHPQKEEMLFTRTIRLGSQIPETSSGTESVDGRITGLNLVCAQPLTIAIEFENTSNGMLRPDGRLEIKDITGETIRSIPIEAFSIFPGKKRLLNCIDEGAKLLPGTYLALGLIDSRDGVVIAAQRMFKVR